MITPFIDPLEPQGGLGMVVEQELPFGPDDKKRQAAANRQATRRAKKRIAGVSAVLVELPAVDRQELHTLSGHVPELSQAEFMRRSLLLGAKFLVNQGGRLPAGDKIKGTSND